MLRPLTLLVLASAPFCVPAIQAGDAAPPAPAAATALPTKAEVEALVGQAQAWLLAQQQPNGSFMPGNEFGVGLTGLVTTTLASGPNALPASDPHIAKALAFLASFHQKDGGFYDPSEGLGDYGTSVTLMAMTATKTGDPATIKAAQQYLFGIQNNDPKDPAHGGIGYGDDKPGDENVNTTTFAVRALRETGVPASDPHLQEALKFLQRCQNLSSVNDQPWAKNAAPADVGGAVYSPKESKANGSGAGAGDNAAQAAEAATGQLHSYGGMTYALISSYLALDLKPTDERVAAALAWVKEHYRLDANPGMRPGSERDGLFYYYGVMGRTFDLLDVTTFATKDGRTVDWRADLFATIKAQAIPAKSGIGMMWMNSSKRWGEQVPHITTAYMLMALKHIHASL
jgi:squalene-hopene/tetraprenyl-beta-curcumene cyclase